MAQRRSPTRRSLAVVLTLALALTMALVGCGDDDDNGEAGGEGPRFIYVTPNPVGINRFLELGQIGTERAAEKHDGTATTFESTDLNSRRANLEAAIDEAPDIIVLTTFEFTEMSKEFADANPDQEFILIDACPEDPPANLHCGVFREHEGAYLLGIMAGRLTETDQIGSVVALDIPFLHRWSDGFAQGAMSVNPAVTDSQLFIGGDNPFSDPARAKEQALALAAQGADHIFAVGAGSNGGVFEAAEEEEFFTYGVDVNQCPDAPGRIVDNNLKLVDNVVEMLIDGILDGSAESLNSFGLAEGGTGVVALADDVAESECVVADHPDIVEEVQTVADQIIAGELEVEDPLAAAD
ncbi:MAG: BMP family ABC transporter substrate-binding protein [Acidimicrobiales bacterium]